jgi:hypothetical protein
MKIKDLVIADVPFQVRTDSGRAAAGRSSGKNQVTCL